MFAELIRNVLPIHCMVELALEVTWIRWSLFTLWSAWGSLEIAAHTNNTFVDLLVIQSTCLIRPNIFGPWVTAINRFHSTCIQFSCASLFQGAFVKYMASQNTCTVLKNICMQWCMRCNRMWVLVKGTCYCAFYFTCIMHNY